MKIHINTKKVSETELDAAIGFLVRLKQDLYGEEAAEVDAGPTELSEQEISALVDTMHQYALTETWGKSFKINELYRQAVGGTWVDLGSNTRKVLGRRFKKACDEYAAITVDGALIVEFKERNIQNTAIYHVVAKAGL